MGLLMRSKCLQIVMLEHGLYGSGQRGQIESSRWDKTFITNDAVYRKEQRVTCPGIRHKLVTRIHDAALLRFAQKPPHLSRHGISVSTGTAQRLTQAGPVLHMPIANLITGSRH